MYRDSGMATRSAERTGRRPGSGLPVLWNPESLERIESHAQRWGSLGLPHGPLHVTHHRGINISFRSHSKLKVLCGVGYATTLDFGSRVVSKLNVESSSKLIDSDEEDNEEEIILQKPLIKRAFDSLKHLRLGKVTKVDSSSPVVKSFHRHLEIVCRLLSKFEESGSSTAPVDQKSMSYSFILSFLCLLSRFNELSSFFNAPSKFTEDLEKCEKAVSCCVKDVASLMNACSTYLEDNRKSEPEMAVPIETAPARPLEGSGWIIPSCCADVMTRAVNRARAILGNLFDDQTPLDQTSSTSSLPSSSSTNLSSTQLENSGGIPSSSEPLQDPLHLPRPTSFSSVALSKSNESDSHFEEERSMVENRAVREMDAQNRARSHRPVKRGSSTSDDRKKVAAKIQKTPSRNQIAIDDSHSTPPTSLNRSFSSSGHPITTQVDIQAHNPISSESGDIPLTDENLQLLKEHQKGFSVRYYLFFKHATSTKKTCLLCNELLSVSFLQKHIRLHLRESKQTLKQLLDYCCRTGKAPPIMNAYTIAKLIKNSFEEVKVCPVCFVPSDEGWTHFGQHILHVHLKVVERCKKLDSLVKKCFVNVSDGESGVKKYSCAICGTAYKSAFLHKNIEECLRRVPNSENRPLVELAAVYEWFLNESKDGKCPHCKNKIKDFGWFHFNKCQANYTCGVKVESGSIREICPNCHIPFGCEDFFKAHSDSDSCNKLRDVNTRFNIDDYCDREPEKNKVKCSVALGETNKYGEICWLKILPSHLATAHQIEGIKDEDWILCGGKCWCQWCGEGLNRFQHQ